MIIRRHAPAFLALAVATIVLLPAPARAQDGIPDRTGLQMDVRPWLEGWYDAGQWVALDARLRNTGEPIEVELRASSTSAAEWFTQVDLPRGADKRVPLLVRPDSDGVEVVVARPGGTTLTTRFLSLRRTRPGEYLVGVVGGAQARALPGLDSSQSRPIATTVDALPENSLALGSVDALVLDEPDLGRASEAQLEALRQWVALGGTLVIPGTPALSATLDALPTALRPGTARGTATVPDLGASLAASGLIGERAVDWAGGATVAALAPGADAEVLAGASEAPLILHQPYGDGHVWLLAFDPGEPPVSRWGDLDLLWGALRRHDITAWDQSPPALESLVSGLWDQQATRLPSASWALLLLAGYIFFVGPVNYLALKRRRRLDLAWLTIPAITLVATLGTYAVGVRLHGRELVTRQLSSVRVVPGAGVARVTTLVALFSPAARAYDVRLPGATAYVVNVADLSPDGPLRVLESPEGGVEDLVASQWSTVGFAADAVIPWPAADGGPAIVSPDGATVQAINPFGRALEGAQALVPGRVHWLGELAPGAPAQVPLKRLGARSVVTVAGPGHAATPMLLALVNGTFGYTDRGIDPYYDPMSGYMGTSDPSTHIEVVPVEDLVLFGFDDRSPIPAQVAGAVSTRREASLYYARWPLPEGEAPAKRPAVVVLPSAVIPQNTECGGEGGPLDLQADGGKIRFEFDQASLEKLDWYEPVWVSVSLSEKSMQAMEAAGAEPWAILDQLRLDAALFGAGFPSYGTEGLGIAPSGQALPEDLHPAIIESLRAGANLRLEFSVHYTGSLISGGGYPPGWPTVGWGHCLTVRLMDQPAGGEVAP